jgi:CBS domain-containing protein
MVVPGIIRSDWEKTMRVRDIMTHPVFTVRSTDPIEGAAALLADRRITAAPVVDGDGRLVGIVSEGDLLRDRVPDDPTAHLRPVTVNHHRPRVVAEVMTREVVTGWLDEDVSDVVRTMLSHNVRSLPVLDGGRLVGIISRRDLLRTVVRSDAVLRDEVQQRLDGYAGDVRRWTATVVDGTVTVDGGFDDETEQRIVSVMVRTVPGVGGMTLSQPVG